MAYACTFTFHNGHIVFAPYSGHVTLTLTLNHLHMYTRTLITWQSFVEIGYGFLVKNLRQGQGQTHEWTDKGQLSNYIKAN